MSPDVVAERMWGFLELVVEPFFGANIPPLIYLVRIEIAL